MRSDTGMARASIAIATLAILATNAAGAEQPIPGLERALTVARQAPRLPKPGRGRAFRYPL